MLCHKRNISKSLNITMEVYIIIPKKYSQQIWWNTRNKNKRVKDITTQYEL